LLDQQTAYNVTVYAQNVPHLAGAQAQNHMCPSLISQPSFGSICKPFLFQFFSVNSVFSFVGR